MTLNITDAELHEWAKMRADDAGRLARELVACRLQSQAAVAAAYEAAARVVGWEAYVADTSPQYLSDWQRGLVAGQQAMSKAIRALATPDQIAALAAERAATVTVKPLVWDDRGYEWSWWADTALGRGTYQIRCEGGIGYLVDFDGVTIGEPHDTLEAAKAAAQADYDARIRSAITIASWASPDTIPMPRAEVEALMEAADKIANWTIGGMLADDPENRSKYPLLSDSIISLRKALATLQERMK